VPEASQPQSRVTAAADGAMEVVEGALYVFVGLLLVASAVVALVAIGYDLVNEIDEGALGAATAALDGLLLVFILVSSSAPCAPRSRSASSWPSRSWWWG
jgi:hypothetical protein